MYHPGEVKWSLPIEVPADAQVGQHTIRGAIAYQACTATNCLLPMGLRFEVTLNVLPADAPEGDGSDQLTAIKLVTVTSKEAKTLAKDAKWVDEITPVVEAPEQPATEQPASESPVPSEPQIDAIETPAVAAAAINSSDDVTAEPETAIGLPLILTFAFIGGFILNFMPCVLPVVGLKVMSFVQQAGADRRRAFLLNAAYSAGIMAIFAGLAVLMIFFSMAWGEMFTYMSVRIGLIVLLFAMALSYFGFWELPAPGMASSKGAQDLQKREGYTGAFFKGMFATILSTPCSGPLLGGIFPLIGGKLSPIESTIVILVVGLGMAVPYIMMGIWPKLTSWLPKPGPWMETFKEFLAFLFLATVAFFFYTFKDEDKLWVFVCLMGVWFGCWIIGKTPAWQTLQRRTIAWVSGVTAAVAISVLAFQFLGPVPPGQQVDRAEETLIAWEDYNEDRLQALQAEGKTVLVDFSAKWCLSCLVNLSVAIDTKPTAELVDELGAVAMYADWTDHSPEIKAKLDELESKSIPLLAIYPGSNPKKPILLRDLVTQQDVLKALREAGPSQDAAVATRNPGSPRTIANR
jgi:thiol:disulfide interchange protein